MIVKQFKTGREAKEYLLCLKEMFNKENEGNFESFETRGVEYGYILNEAAKQISDFSSVDFVALIEKEVSLEQFSIFLEANKEKLKGGTIKFKLSDVSNKKIDQLTLYLSNLLKIRVYRAFTVKLLLKYSFMSRTNQL